MRALKWLVGTATVAACVVVTAVAGAAPFGAAAADDIAAPASVAVPGPEIRDAGVTDLTGSSSTADAAPEPTNIFTTIGITQSATKQNSGIRGGWSLPAEQMPASRAVVVPPDDAADDVLLRMPNTGGSVSNLAAFRGQTVVLRAPEQQKYAKVHFFGTTTDGGPAGGDFVLTYTDGSTDTVQVRFPDWCAQPTAPAHSAIGPLTGRHTATGADDGAHCGIFHVPAGADPAKTLASVTLPSSTTGTAGADTQAYLMALTLEDAGGAFVTPDLGASPFPDDLTAPESQHALDPATPQGQAGWYSSSVQVSLTSADEAGGSGIDRTDYSVDGAALHAYTSAFTVAGEGRHTILYRAVDRAGNTETPHTIAVNIDATAPVSEPVLDPRRPTAGSWYDTPVTLTLRGSDGSGSGIVKREFRVGGGPWRVYTAPVAFGAAGRYSVAVRATDEAGYVETPGAPVTFNVDGAAPVTSALIDGAAPAQNYTAPVQVALRAGDGGGSGVTRTEYSVDGSAWRAYGGALAVTGSGVHVVDYRSRDAAGNLENAREAVFRITLAAQGGGGTPQPAPWAGVVKPPHTRSTVAALRRGKLTVGVRCLAVSRGTLRLVVSRATAKRLHLKSRTLASRTFRCHDDGRVDVRLDPSRKVRRALARHLGRRSLHAVLAVRATGAGGSATATRKVVLRGR